MLLDDIGGGFATGRHRENDDAVLGLDLDDRLPSTLIPKLRRLAVFGILGHGRGDVVVDPVTVALVVIVRAPPKPSFFTT